MTQAGTASGGEPGAEPLPRRTRITYASGSIAGNALTQTWALWLIYFYAPPDDADIATRIPELGALDARVVLGIVLTAARIIEAVDDPLIGYWSDRTRSRWGRRIPFIVLGTPWWIVLFVLLFTPPAGEASWANVVHLFIVAQLYFLASNIASAPLEALLPHFARRSDDRVSVGSWQVLFGVTGAAIGLSLSSLLRDIAGFTVMAVTVAAIALVARSVALGGIWRYACSDATPSASGLRNSLRELFANRQFLAFLPSFVLFQIGLQLLTAVLPFFVDAVLHDATLLDWSGDTDEGVFTFLLTGVVIAGMLSGVPIFAAIAKRTSKAHAYRRAMLITALYFPLLGVAGFLPGVPELPQSVAAIFLAGVPVAGVFLFPNILTADIVDDDAERSGDSRAAMFYGTQNLLEKLATSFTPLIFALILVAGDTAEDPLGVRLVGPIAAALVLIGYLAFRRYSLPDVRPTPD